MDPQRVRELEDEIARAIALVLDKHSLPRPFRARTVHLMAKAAVTVLEAVMETPARDAS
jgi:hypothetical protein